MRIIEIAPLSNGAHRNQSGGISTVPEGWAVIPNGMEIPETFPFVNIEVEDGSEDNVPFVVSMSAGVVPEPEPVPEAEPEVTVWDELDAAYQKGYNEGYTEGVNTAYDQ